MVNVKEEQTLEEKLKAYETKFEELVEVIRNLSQENNNTLTLIASVNEKTLALGDELKDLTDKVKILEASSIVGVNHNMSVTR